MDGRLNLKPAMVFALVVIVLLAAGAFIFARRGNETKTAASITPVQTEQTQQARRYTTEEVAKHMDASSCWTIIEGRVYDITRYIPNHPGGSEILRACGQDGTTLFNSRRTDEGVRVGTGTPHSSSARSMLETFEIGELAD